MDRLGTEDIKDSNQIKKDYLKMYRKIYNKLVALRNFPQATKASVSDGLHLLVQCLENPMWSSAVVAHPPQGLTCCAF